MIGKAFGALLGLTVGFTFLVAASAWRASHPHPATVHYTWPYGEYWPSI